MKDKFPLNTNIKTRANFLKWQKVIFFSIYKEMKTMVSTKISKQNNMWNKDVKLKCQNCLTRNYVIHNLHVFQIYSMFCIFLSFYFATTCVKCKKSRSFQIQKISLCPIWLNDVNYNITNKFSVVSHSIVIIMDMYCNFECVFSALHLIF